MMKDLLLRIQRWFNRRNLMSGSGLILVMVLFVSMNIIANLLFTTLRLDLTENNLFTLSDGTRNILRNLDEPITLKLYASRGPLSEHPLLSNYSIRVRDMLKEYEGYANGKLIIQYIDPEPFSEAEDQAVSDGIKTIPVGGDVVQAYFGLAGTNSTDDSAVIPFLAPNKESSLEYEVTKLVYNLQRPQRRVVGIYSSLPIFGEGPKPEPWTFLTSIQEFFEVRDLGNAPTDLENIDVLMLVHPKDLNAQQLYSIDQYVLQGGKLLALIDPMSDWELSNPDPEWDQDTLPDLDSDLDVLLNAWGVEMLPSKVAGDLESAMRVQHRGTRGLQQIEYLPWLRLEEGNLSQDDFSTSELKLIHLGAAGVLRSMAAGKSDSDAGDGDDAIVPAGPHPTMTPLMSTTEASMLMERDLVLFQRNPVDLLNAFISGNEKLNLAVRLSGQAVSAFDGPPAPEAEEGEEAPPPPPDDGSHVSEGEVNAIVVADSDLLQDRFWVRIRKLFDIRIPQKIASNGDFIANALENLSGNTDLISLRSRGEYSRPFTRVEALRKEAEAKFRNKERELKEKLQQTEDRITALQQKNEGGEAIISRQQAREIEKFREEKVETRKQLRAVQHGLNKSIEQLGSWLKFLNIILVPFLVVLGSLLAYYLRRHQRSMPWK